MVDDILLVKNTDVSVVAEEADVATVSAEASSVIITDEVVVPGPDVLPAPTQVPVFKAQLGVAGQTPVVNIWTKVNCNLKEFDTDNYFDIVTSRFTPRIAGHYLLTGTISATGAVVSGIVGAALKKNGAFKSLNAVTSPGGGQLLTSALIYFNGSTDYAELWGYSSGSPPYFYGDEIDAVNTQSSFNGVLVRAWSQDLGLVAPGLDTIAITDAKYAGLEAVAASNIAINGGMGVSQENGATQVTLATGVSKYIVDMFAAIYLHAANTAVFKGQQVAPPGSPVFGFGLRKCLQLTATTAFTSPAAGDFVFFRHPTEGYRIEKLGFGGFVANPKFFTVSFWVYATVAGTASVCVRNAANNRSYVINFTVDVALTWEYKTITIPVDVTGTYDFTTGMGFDLGFCFGCGATYQGANNAWSAGNFLGTSSNTNFYATANNTVCITGVGIWPGEKAPTVIKSQFAQRPYTEELLLCMRYLEIQGTSFINVIRAQVASCQVFAQLSWLVPKRIQPALALLSPVYSNGSSGQLFNATLTGCEVSFVSSAASPVTGTSYMTYGISADARFP